MALLEEILPGDAIFGGLFDDRTLDLGVIFFLYWSIGVLMEMKFLEGCVRR